MKGVKMKNKIIALNSVGSGIDSSNGMVYPQFQNGEYDINNGIHLLDIDNKEWFKTLDKKDEETINEYVKKRTEFWGVK